ncbi:MAG: hypothetical protein RSD25_01570 [Raoultibacter sp.]
MEAIYPITALQKKQREVKAAAAKGIVRITEQGVGAYIFSSESAYAEALQKATAEAVFEARMHDALAEARADVAAGRIYTDAHAFFDEVEAELDLR